MHDINDALSRAARRLFYIGFLRGLVVMGTASSALLLLLVIAEKLGPVQFDWRIIAGAAAGITLLTAFVSAAVRRPRGVALADELDRRAGLRETLSTAVAMKSSNDAWASAVRDSANERARRIVMQDAVPVRMPKGWQTPMLLLAVAGLGLWLAPRHDLSGLLDRRMAEDEQQTEIRTVALEIQSRENELKEVLDRAGVEMEEDESSAEDSAEQDKPKSVEELNRAALKKLTKLSDSLNAAQKSEKSEQMKALQQNIERLKTPGPGPMTEFARSLARGQFKDAKQALEELSDALQQGEMSDEQKMQASEQLKALAEQMEKLAQQKEALKQQLEKQGMDADQAERLASDPAALKEALEKMQNMTPEEREALMNSALGQMKASEAMQSMSNAMSQMSQQMAEACQNPGESGQAGQQGQSGQQMSEAMQKSMQQMSDQLSACEMAGAEMQALSQAMSECQSQMAQYGQGMCENPGQGYGKGKGKGMGGGIGEADVANDFDSPLAARDDYMLKSEKTDVANNGGPIIGSTMVYGAQVKGEATAQFGQAVGASSIQAAEAIESMRVPREYHDAVRHYFGRLEKLAESDAPAKKD